MRLGLRATYPVHEAHNMETSGTREHGLVLIPRGIMAKTEEIEGEEVMRIIHMHQFLLFCQRIEEDEKSAIVMHGNQAVPRAHQCYHGSAIMAAGKADRNLDPAAGVDT